MRAKIKYLGKLIAFFEPSTALSPPAAAPTVDSCSAHDDPMSGGDWTIPEDEQRRIIESSGILRDQGIRPSQLLRPRDQTAPLIREDELEPPKDSDDEDDDNNDGELSPLADELFTDFLWLAIFTFLFVGLSAASFVDREGNSG
jgi:hypothetical protein